jgi:hypothetical protein
MQAKPARPSKREAGDGQDGAEEAVERDGPLEVRRLRKDDGRQLIAYYRAGEDPPET